MVGGRCWTGAGALPGAGVVGPAVFGGAKAGAGAITGALGAPVGPPGGNVGSLIVGAAVGFGGKLMRTVSFFGCTLPVSFFGGGTAPDGPVGPDGGMGGGISAI